METIETIVEARVDRVTVYPDRARVTCLGTATLTEGKQQLLIEALPLTLEPDSVRVAGEGTARVRILGVDVQRRHYQETPTVRVQALEQEIEGVQDELKVLKDKKAGLLAQMKYIDGLRQATTEFAWGLSRRRTTVEDQVQLVAFLQEQDEAIRAEVHEADLAQRGLNRQLNKLQRELKQLQSARPRQRFEAKIEVDVLTAGSFSTALSYVVNKAGWQPLYDVRLLHKENGRFLAVTYIAQITQKTGQDWPNARLAVSTARPALNQRLPELKPWYVNVYTPPPPSPKRPMVRSAKAAAPMATAMSMDADVIEDVAFAMAAPEPMEEAEVAVATAISSGTAVTYEVSDRGDIPSDGSPHKTTIGYFDFDPELDYLTVPKHTDAVFRRVKVNNSSPGPLLAGPVSLFVADEFIGRTKLVYTPANGEIELLLGVEERITIERELMKRDVDKRRLRDNRQLRYGYKISVKNLLPESVNVEVHDNIPVARHEQIKVKLEQTRPDPSEQTDLNLLEWHLRLAPDQEQTILYEYMIEHPRQLQVIGLMD